MPLYFIKPVVWNDQKYKKPSGAQFTSGYPKQNGFGHEEWNNSDQFEFTENGKKFRIFHIEQLGIQPVEKYPADIFILMVASHEGSQYLVGIAGEATSLWGGQNEDARDAIRKNNLGDHRWRDAWALPSVKANYDNNIQAFRNQWNEDTSGMPGWKCPSSLFLWLDAPLLLNPLALTGKKRFITMYSSYQKVSRSLVSEILNLIPSQSNSEALNNLKAQCASGELDMLTDLAELNSNTNLSETSRETLIKARLGQGKFREKLLSAWGNKCAVSGCSIKEMLRASHIRPWRDSSNKQRLDPDNGLLLEANLDALFDAGLITFSDTGEMLISKAITDAEQRKLGLPSPLRRSPNSSQREHLAFHRGEIWKDRSN